MSGEQDADVGGGSLLAAAVRAGTTAVTRSHRLHRRRGGFCARGYCQQCPIQTTAGSQLACELAEGRPPRPGLDPLRPLALAGQALPPWFWDRWFRRPRLLRQTYLRTLRSLTAGGRLPAAPARARGGSASDVTTDLLVVGGGPCGVIAAARVAAEDGTRVTLLTRGRIGGSAPVDDATEAELRRDLASLGSAPATLLPSTVCLGLYEEEGLAAALGPAGPFAVRFERLVIATGAYDRLPLVRGNDLPGIVGLRAFERLASQGAFTRGRRVGITATAPELRRALAAASAFGVEPAWSVPLESPERLIAVSGRRRVRGARFAIAGRRGCDVLVVGGGQPSYELQIQAGCIPAVEGAPATIRTDGAARMPMLVVGEAAGIVEPALARAAAARDAIAWSRDPRILPAPTSFPGGPPGARPDPAAFVCLCEDVRVRDVARAIEEGYGDLELIKRRTGATTGPCQGKLCLGPLCDAAAATGVTPQIPTVRPPLRPARIRDLAAGR